MRNLALSVVLAAATVMYVGCSGSGNGGGGGGGAGGDGTGGTGGDSGWQQLGGAVTAGGATQFSLAHDGTNPVVAWVEREPNGYQVYVKRWDGSSWVQLGGALSARRTTIARTVEVAVDAGDQPVVAFTDSDLLQLHVRRWLGDDWDGPSASTRGANPSLVVDGNDEPVVAMQSGTDLGDLVVRRWTTDDGWVPIGDRLNVFDDKTAGFPSIALDPEGSPVVAFSQGVGESASDAQVYVKRWGDPSWVQIGPSGFPGGLGPRAGDASLDIGNSGEIFVAWVDFSSTLRLYPFVMEWAEDDPVWRQTGPTLASVEDGGDEPSLAVTAANPIVAYRTFDQAACQFAVIVKRWDGSGWQQLGEALNEDDCSCGLEDQSGCQAVDMASLVLDGSGNPVVAWQERRRDEPETGTIYVKTLRLP
ncbi:MAG: hypothetical protein OEM15_13435 [Myxococcales bacterium]|nr:hypothetical protein [Myxococcales bacterium]